MRIAFDATPLLGQGTGIATFTRGAFTALAEHADAELTGYSLTWRGRGQLRYAAPPGVAVMERPMPALALLALWARFEHPVVERWTGPIDVVHGTNFVVPPARRAARIVSVHDLTAVHHPELCAPASLRYPSLVTRAAARGAFVHTHTQAIAAEIVDILGVPTDRVRVVPSGVDATDPGDPERGADLAGSEQFVLALGTVEPRKALPALVSAFDELAARVPACHLVIAGPAGWGEDALTAACQQSRARDRIRRLGYVGPRERADLLAAAAAFAYPSVYEGFGYPPLEAMAAGVPVVATAVGSLPEVLGDAAVLVAPGDGAALTDALARVLEDAALSARLGAAGRERVARFTWSACAEGLLDLYRDAAAARATGAPTG